MKLSVIIPVFNEVNSILDILYLVQKSQIDPHDKEIIIIDDFSIDGTRELLKKLDNHKLISSFFEISNDKTIDLTIIKIYFQDQNYGKGAALRSGFEKATGDLILIQDADLEYDPNDYMKLIDPIIQQKAEVVYGSRYLNHNSKNNQYFTHKFANKLLTQLFNKLNNQNLTDMETCYKVFKKDLVPKLTIEQNRFGFEPEITAKISKLGIKITELPINYYGRKYNEGKKIGVRDGLNAIYCIFRYSL